MSALAQEGGGGLIGIGKGAPASCAHEITRVRDGRP